MGLSVTKDNGPLSETNNSDNCQIAMKEIPAALSINEAAEWASKFTNKNVTPNNITYLLQYGKVQKHPLNGKTGVLLKELQEYYERYASEVRDKFTEALGEDINWDLSFSLVKEAETTKHVHRLHPYKGKFIPQLAEYFLDSHTDNFKREVYFRQGDVVLDPFAGSGTTLVQANELDMHSIGLDISHFNCLIAEAKLAAYHLESLRARCQELSRAIESEHENSGISVLDHELDALLASVNKRYFPNDYRYKIAHKETDETAISEVATAKVMQGWKKLLKKHKLTLEARLTGSCFLDTWYAAPALKEALNARAMLEQIPDAEKKLLTVLLSRTLRSCRATPHYQLERLEQPIFEPYYCYKHLKICRPIFSLSDKFTRYYQDTLKRIEEFQAIRTDTHHVLLDSDSRKLDIFSAIRQKNPSFYDLVRRQKIQGIFTSPPYVGQLDYHEQHEYAYEFFGYTRRDNEEIGKSSRGKGGKAQQDYIRDISDALINCRKYLADDSHVFIVANDQQGLYPEIAEHSGLRIVQEFKRPVLNRTSRDKNPYGESIFHMA